MKKAILAVSFGTGHPGRRKVSMEAIENAIKERFPACQVYRAWTSGRMIQKVKEQEGLTVMTVPQAFCRMREEGITDVVLQPIHVVNGRENEKMREDAANCRDWFDSFKIGDVLLAQKRDYEAVILAVAREYQTPASKEALVLMGHGTACRANDHYRALAREMENGRYPGVFLGIMGDDSGLKVIFHTLKERGYHKVCLAPFMIVAGKHAEDDLSGEEGDSWRSRFLREGFEVRVVKKGLGEIEGIRKIFLEHIERAGAE